MGGGMGWVAGVRPKKVFLGAAWVSGNTHTHTHTRACPSCPRWRKANDVDSVLEGFEFPEKVEFHKFYPEGGCTRR